MTDLLAAIRWLHEASLMLLFGATLLRAIYQRRLPEAAAREDQRWFVAAGLLALVSALAWLGAATARMAGDAAAMIDPQILWLAVSDTLFGQILVARMTLLLLLCTGLLLNWREALLAFLAGLALVLIAVTSHAAGASPAHFAAIGITSDALHLLAGGVWIGGLAVLAPLAARRAAALTAATAIFAESGMIAVALLAMTGLLNAATILLGGEGHDTAAYLAVLGLKLLLVLAMVTLALVNHFRLLPALAGGGAATALNRNVRWELGLGLAVVALAGLLGSLPPTL